MKSKDKGTNLFLIMNLIRFITFENLLKVRSLNLKENSMSQDCEPCKKVCTIDMVHQNGKLGSVNNSEKINEYAFHVIHS